MSAFDDDAGMAGDTLADISEAAERMIRWAQRHPECDTQGIMADEWIGLATAALGLDADS